MNTIEKNLKAAQEHCESAMNIINRRDSADWHQVQSAIAQMTQATAALNRLLGAIDQRDDTTHG